MNSLARFAHMISRKFLKKRRQSIEGGQGFNRKKAAKLSMDDSMVDENDDPPLTPTHARAVHFLVASTPVKTPGILEHVGSSEHGDEDEVSQGEDCIDWNRSIHDIHVDTVEEYVIAGGDDSSSLFSENYDETEREKIGGTKKENNEDSISSQFHFEDVYEEDEFDDIAELQSTLPIQRSMKNESPTFYPTVLVPDSDGYFWDEPLGFSDPSLAPSVNSNITFPKLCGNSEEEIMNLARTLMEEDSNVLEETKRNQSNNPINSTYVINAVISPSARPDTPTTNEGNIESPTINRWKETLNASCDLSDSPSSSLFRPIRPSTAQDEDSEWLRSLYEKTGLSHEIPEWMRVDPSKKESNNKESPIAEIVKNERKRFTTSTPVISMPSPAFSSISTIAAHLNDSSRTFNSPGLNFTLDMGVRTRAILAQPTTNYYRTAFDMDLED